jgi:hypothetical protein
MHLQTLRYIAETMSARPARPGICPMLGSLRFAFSLFAFLSFLFDNPLIRIGLVALSGYAFRCETDFVAVAVAGKRELTISGLRALVLVASLSMLSVILRRFARVCCLLTIMGALGCAI